MNSEQNTSSKIFDDNISVATANGVFVIPKRFLPQVLKGIDEITTTMAEESKAN